MLNIRIVLFFLGILITALGVSMIVPFVVEFNSLKINSENFLICLLFCLFVGVSLILAFKEEEKKSKC